MRFISKYDEVLGITKCLRQETTSFIVHFRNRADEEWNSSKREECVTNMAEKYKNSEGRAVQIFGISSKDLSEYITTEKDILRKICKMPSVEFLIQGQSAEPGDDMDFDDDDTIGDDWIMVDAAPKKVEFDQSEM